jgi:phage-related protein (TIGR01555 family)
LTLIGINFKFWGKKPSEPTPPLPAIDDTDIMSVVKKEPTIEHYKNMLLEREQFGQQYSNMDMSQYFKIPEFQKIVDGQTKTVAMDEKLKKAYAMDMGAMAAMDGNIGNDVGAKGAFVPSISPVIFSWYATQTFIGYQACGLISQNWLINKGCAQIGLDAVRNGFTLNFDESVKVDAKQIADIEKLDRKYKLKKNLELASKFQRVYGIRHVLFVVGNGYDEDYYTSPFDPANIPKGQYKGMSQIDPYWMAPQLSSANINSPASIGFYDPDFWMVAGDVYHKSHFVILRGPEVTDILKPTYLYGGLPLSQLMMQRVYAAELTADETPQLAMTKRMDVRKMDLKKAQANQTLFRKTISWIAQMRNNHSISIIGKDEEYERHDTSLSDLDDVTLLQYQIVAGIVNTPITELLGLSPTGLGSSGENETKSYIAAIEVIQENDLSPIVLQHHECLAASEGLKIGIEHTWNPLAVMSDKELAEIRKMNSETAGNYVDIGAIDNYEVRDGMIANEDSGYTGLVELDRPDGDRSELDDPVNKPQENEADTDNETGSE